MCYNRTMKNEIKKLSWKVCAAVYGAIVVALIIFSVSVSPTLVPHAFGASSSSSTAISVTVNQAITLTMSTATVNFTSLTPNIPATSTFYATVSTNDVDGFTLTATRPAASSTAIASGSIPFADAPALWNGSDASTSAQLGTASTSLAFREYQGGTTVGDYSATNWGASDSDPTALYAGIPTSSVAFASTSTYVGVPQTIYAEIRANAAATQQATTYSGTITITALGQP